MKRHSTNSNTIEYTERIGEQGELINFVSPTRRQIVSQASRSCMFQARMVDISVSDEAQ